MRQRRSSLIVLLALLLPLAACNRGAGVTPLPELTLSGVTPQRASTEGGTTVTLRGANFFEVLAGSGFQQELAVSVCGAPLSDLQVEGEARDIVVPPAQSLRIRLGDTLTGTLPATDPASAGDVVVTRPDGQSQTLEDAVACYDPAPRIASFTVAAPVEADLPISLTWTVHSPEGQALACTLDPGDGSKPYAIGDCLATTRQTHTYAAEGSYTATLTVSDSAGRERSQPLMVHVGNAPPAFTSSPVTAAVEGEPYRYTLTAEDINGDALTLRALSAPAWLTLYDAGDGSATLRGTPGAGDVGRHQVVVRVSDGVADVEQTFTVEVVSTNAELRALRLSHGTLDPAFDPAVGAYTASVPHAVASLTVTAVPAREDARLTIDGVPTASGLASAPIALAVGETGIALEVTAGDGLTTRRTTVTVTRAPAPGSTLWTRQFGTGWAVTEFIDDVAVDGAGFVFVAGRTHGALEGSNAGGADAFVRKYDSNGAVVWARQFGTADTDVIESVAVDEAGFVLVTGTTFGTLEDSGAGEADAFVRKFDAHGNELWTRQFGSASYDFGESVAVDASGHVLVAGRTHGALVGDNAGRDDVYVRKFDRNGDVMWTRQFGSYASEDLEGVAVDASGHVLVVGDTFGAIEGSNAGGYDAYVRKFDRNGEELWTRQFGTANYEYVGGVAVDGDGQVLVAGQSSEGFADIDADARDAFVRKFDADGVLLWARQFGTEADEYIEDVAVDASDNVLVAGDAYGALEGSNAGGRDAFVRKFDTNGEELWTQQFGTGEDEYVHGVAVDGAGRVFVGGGTYGALEGRNAGGLDAFLRKLRP